MNILYFDSDSREEEESSEEFYSSSTKPASNITRQKLERGMTLVNIVDTALSALDIGTPKSRLKESVDQNESMESCDGAAGGENAQVNTEQSFTGDQVDSGKSAEGTKTPNLSRKIALKQMQQKHSRHHQKRAKRSSDPYFIALFWLFAISRIWLHQWILTTLPILLIILFLKAVSKKLELYDLFMKKLRHLGQILSDFYKDRADIILPGPVKGIVSIIHSGDQKVKQLKIKRVFLMVNVFLLFIDSTGFGHHSHSHSICFCFWWAL